MKFFTYIITEEEGLHARPAAKLAKEARKYSSDLAVSSENGSADLKKLVAVLKLCITKGTTIKISVSGGNEVEDCEALRRYFEDNL